MNALEMGAVQVGACLSTAMLFTPVQPCADSMHAVQATSKGRDQSSPGGHAGIRQAGVDAGRDGPIPVHRWQ